MMALLAARHDALQQPPIRMQRIQRHQVGVAFSLGETVDDMADRLQSPSTDRSAALRKRGSSV